MPLGVERSNLGAMVSGCVLPRAVRRPILLYLVYSNVLTQDGGGDSATISPITKGLRQGVPTTSTAGAHISGMSWLCPVSCVSQSLTFHGSGQSHLPAVVPIACLTKAVSYRNALWFSVGDLAMSEYADEVRNTKQFFHGLF